MSGQILRRHDVIPGLVLVAGGMILTAVWAFGRGAEDWRYEIAGLGNPFLGRPSVGSGVIANVVVTVVVAGVAHLVRAASRRRSPTSALTGRAAGSAWLWLVAAVWVGYAAGGVVTIAGGGPTVTGGTMHLEFGAPLHSTADAPITCRSVVGESDQVAEIDPLADGLFRLVVREITSGRPWMPADAFLTDDYIPGNEFEPPDLPERVAPHMLASQADGSTTEARTITFMQAYDHQVTRSVASGRSGVVELTARRWNDPSGGQGYRWVDMEIPNDPWPETFALRIQWTCDSPAS